MNMKRAAALISTALLATAMALPAMAQNNPPPSAVSSHSATVGAANSESRDGSVATAHPRHQHPAQVTHKKKKQSFSKRMHDKAQKFLSAIKQ